MTVRSTPNLSHTIFICVANLIVVRDVIMTRGQKMLATLMQPITAGVIPTLIFVPSFHTIVTLINATTYPRKDALECNDFPTTPSCSMARPWAVPNMIMQVKLIA